MIIDDDKEGRKVAVPKDLTAALKKRKGAAAAFEKQSPSHRKEYVSWIESAKKDETRQRRVAKAVEMICDGARLKG